MTQKAIGPSFYDELLAKGGLVGEHFSWYADGTIEFFYDTPKAVVDGVSAVYEAHDPSVIPLASQARAAVTAGLQLVSEATPDLNATYAIDQVSRLDIIAIETGVNAGTGFPNGGSMFNYPDINGTLHAFSETNFREFAAAVREYVYALNAVLAGSATSLPDPKVSIS
jgi:hypothetical protein